MHDDKGISAKTYLNQLVVKIFQVEIMCSGCKLSLV